VIEQGSQADEPADKPTLAGECFISMQKIMRSELKAFAVRDSAVFRHSMSMSRKMSGNYSLEISAMHDSPSHIQTPIIPKAKPDPSSLRDLFLQPSDQVKHFREIVTLAGKHLGKLKGTFKISNLPLL
jgi:hypothetical protein